MDEDQQRLDNVEFSGGILPSQFVDLNKRRHALEGEYRLMYAVLEDAVRRYLANLGGQSPVQRKILRETLSWFRKRSDHTRGIYSFESICDFLGMDADGLRRGLISLQQREPLRRRAA